MHILQIKKSERILTTNSPEHVQLLNVKGRFLKGRWRLLQSCLNLSPEKASDIFTACCVLHNTLQNNGEEYDDADLIDVEHNHAQVAEESVASTEVLRITLAEYIQRKLRNGLRNG